MPNTTTKKDELTKTELTKNHTLVLWNDDDNTFDDIIDALMDICHHDAIQAEQCATLTHYKGKCAVYNSVAVEKLHLMKKRFDYRYIHTTVE